MYALNPNLVHGLKKVYAETGKTDPRDAFLIAERLRIGRLPAPFQLDVVYAPLQRLTRYRTHLSQTLAREKGYFLNFLFVQFSGFSQEKPFSDTFGPTSQALLEQFSTEEIAQASLEDLAAFIQEHGRGGFTDPEVVAANLRRAARESYQLNSALQPPKTRASHLSPTMTDMEKSQLPWDGERGRIDQKMLAGIKSAIYYITCPPGMVKGLRMVLRATSVDDDDVRTEEFTGY